MKILSILGAGALAALLGGCDMMPMSDDAMPHASGSAAMSDDAMADDGMSGSSMQDSSGSGY